MNSTSSSNVLRNIFLAVLVGVLVGVFCYLQARESFPALFSGGLFAWLYGKKYAIDRGGFVYNSDTNTLDWQARMGDNSPLVPLHNSERARISSKRACADYGLDNDSFDEVAGIR